MMRPKKKTILPLKKHKRSLTGPQLMCDKTIVTTKERTHATIEENFQVTDSNPRSKPITPRSNHSIRMEKLDLSPFSSCEGCSLSPRFRNSFSPPIVPVEENKKKYKSKKKTLKPKHLKKSKLKLSAEECNQAAYQNFLARKMDEQKITQRSIQSEQSHPKKSMYKIVQQKQNYGFVGEMKKKIIEKYNKTFPNLSLSQINILASIVVIQRLWRQRKVKQFINIFLSPRQSMIQISHKQNNLSKLDVTNGTQQHTLQLKRMLNFSSQRYIKQLQSTEINQDSDKKKSSSQLKDLQISEQLFPKKINHQQALRFVTCYRNIQLNKLQKKKKNVLNLCHSLSEKCLIQSFYLKLFKLSPQKVENFQLFQGNKTSERSRQLITQLRSPQKHQIIQLNERFCTQLEQSPKQNSFEQSYFLEETPRLGKQYSPMQTYHPSLQNSPAFGSLPLESTPPRTQTLGVQYSPVQIKTIQNIVNFSDKLVSWLCDEFATQYATFALRSIKRQKKKQVPGLSVDQKTIFQYLNGLVDYLLSKQEQTVLLRMKAIQPKFILKFYHFQPKQEEQKEEEQFQFNKPIIPNNIFYQYQCYFQANVFKIIPEHANFTNFLGGLIKVHNLSLVNCFSEILQKKRVESIVQPWDFFHKVQETISRNELRSYLNLVIKKVVDISSTKIGSIHRKSQEKQQKKMLAMIKEDYLTDEKEWEARDQKLEIRMELTEDIFKNLLQQLFTQF